MSWTYDPTRLTDVPFLQVRLLIGDTDADFPFMQDEEIIFLLNQNSNDTRRVAIACLRRRIASLASNPDYKLGPYQESGSKGIDYFYRLLKDLEGELGALQAPLMEPPESHTIFRIDLMSANLPGGDHN